jgi:predicted transcriptional regulator
MLNIGVFMTSAESIKKVRRALCLNQKEFADALSLTPSSISCYEAGSRLPSFTTIRKIIALAKKHNIKINIDDIRPE